MKEAHNLIEHLGYGHIHHGKRDNIIVSQHKKESRHGIFKYEKGKLYQMEVNIGWKEVEPI